MKIEQLIVQYLLKSKKVTLQDIGTFTLAADFTLPAEGDKEIVMPEDALKFEFDKKALPDDALIDFIVAQTRKIKPLAASDLESFSILAKQFLNIGKPFPIEGLGVLLKDQAGIYQFTQGIQINTKMETAAGPGKVKEENEISFASPAKPVVMGKTVKLVLIAFLVLAVAAIIYYFLQKNNKDNTIEKIEKAVQPVPVPDSVVIKKDTTSQITLPPPPDTTVKQVVEPVKKDSSTFHIVVRSYTDRATAEKILAKFHSLGHNLKVIAEDSSHYKIAMLFKRPIADANRVRDSLKFLLGGTPIIEK